MKIGLVSILVLTLIGCGFHTTNFVVYRDVPKNPSFVVIPLNYTEREIAFANQIEHILISCHASVHLRPAIKYVEDQQANREKEEEKGGSSTESSTGKASKTEWYYELDDFTATYTAQSYQRTQQVKISKRETQEILAVIQLPFYDDQFRIPKQTPRMVIAEALDNLGIIRLKKKR